MNHDTHPTHATKKPLPPDASAAEPADAFGPGDPLTDSNRTDLTDADSTNADLKDTDSTDADSLATRALATESEEPYESPSIDGKNLDARRERGALGWLYYRSGITVSALNKVILIGMIAMVVLFIYFAMSSKGFLIVFNPRGGTDVPSQRVLFGDTIDLPEPPTREGYDFVGWSQEPQSDELYDPSTPVDIGFELFAQWEPSD